MKRIRSGINKVFAILLMGFMLLSTGACSSNIQISDGSGDTSSAAISSEPEDQSEELEGKNTATNTDEVEKKDNPTEDGTGFFSVLSGKCFVFSSGAGGWETIIKMNPDGSFRGYYMDSDLGDTGADYPNGTRHESSFSGKFDLAKQIDDYTYSVKLKELKKQEKIGEEKIIDGEKRITAEPYGFETGTDFLFYAPGHPVDSLEDDFYQWINAGASSIIQNEKITVWGLYNVDPQYAMYEDPEALPLEEIEKASSNEMNEDLNNKDSEKTEKEQELIAPKGFIWTADEGGLPDAAGVKATWDNVPGADGYEYRFYLFWGLNNDQWEQGDTKDHYASTYFQDHSDIRIEVRAYRIIDGEKQYSEWGSDIIKEDDVFKL